MSDPLIGLYEKYTVTTKDVNRDIVDCDLFVLDLNCDRFARIAFRAYKKAYGPGLLKSQAHWVVKKNGDEGKHQHCLFVVLDACHDQAALEGIKAYAEACKDEFPLLSNDLFEMYRRHNGKEES